MYQPKNFAVRSAFLVQTAVFTARGYHVDHGGQPRHESNENHVRSEAEMRAQITRERSVAAPGALATLALLSCLLDGPLLCLDLAQCLRMIIIHLNISLLLVCISLRRVDIINDLLSFLLSYFHVFLHLFGVNCTKFFLRLSHDAITD